VYGAVGRASGEDEEKSPKEDLENPTDDVSDAAIPAPHVDDVGEVQSAFAITIILGEDLFELLWNESAFGIKALGVATVFGPVDVLDVDGEARIGDPGRAGWIADVQEVERECGSHRDERVESERPESNNRFVEVNDSIFVSVEVGYMSL